MATVVEGDQKAPFLIATTPRCRGGRYSFPWIASLYPWSFTYIAECWARRYQVPFLKFWYDATWDWTQVFRTIGKLSTHKANEPVRIVPDITMMVWVFAMAWETWVPSLVKSYQRLKKWYWMPSLLNSQHYKVRTKGKVEQSRERSSVLSYALML